MSVFRMPTDKWLELAIPHLPQNKPCLQFAVIRAYLKDVLMLRDCHRLEAVLYKDFDEPLGKFRHCFTSLISLDEDT